MYISRASKNAIGDVYQDNNKNKTMSFINNRCYLFLWQSSEKLFRQVVVQQFYWKTLYSKVFEADGKKHDFSLNEMTLFLIDFKD